MKTFDKKYRSKDLDDLIGNYHIKESFREIKKWPSAILLCGVTGCGKTTVARILADKRNSDLIELNISNTRGIDNARNIIEVSKTKSLLKKGKTIILNECHEATKQFQDAMLEILEEPPHGVVFILCTTDPAKLLPAIRSRCFVYNLNRLTTEESKELLNRVAKAEGIKLTESLSRNILSAADGIPRKILLILDSISSIKSIEQKKEIIKSYDYVEDLSSDETREIARLLLGNGRYGEIMALLRENQDSPEQIKRAICSYMAKVLLDGKINRRAANILDCFVECDAVGLFSIVNSITFLFPGK